MAFTVNDFHDMIEIMEQNPAWRKDLRRVLLGDDFVGIPDLVKELVEINRRNDERFGRVETRMDNLEADVNVLKQDVNVLKQDVNVLKQDVNVLKQDVNVLKQDVGDLKGSDRERRIRERPYIYLGKFARRTRAVSEDDLLALLDQAVLNGSISQAQADDVQRLDVLVTGKLPSGEAVYLAVEVTGTANNHDVERAIRRAQILQAATRLRALPVVSGRRVLPELQQQLESAGGGWAEVEPATADVA
jgi:cell division protein FtsB